MPPKCTADQNGQGSNKKQRTEEQNINEKKSRLIQMVKENPILYDLGDANHKNSKMKKVVWDQIAAELQEDGESIENILFLHNIQRVLCVTVHVVNLLLHNIIFSSM